MSATAAGTEGQAGGAARGQALLDRMDRLPGWPLPRFDLFVLGLAYFFVFYDITDIGFGLPAIVKLIRGTQGVGVMLASTLGELEGILATFSDLGREGVFEREL